MNPKIVPVNRAYYHGGFSFNSPREEKTKQNKTNRQTKPKVFWTLIAAYISVKYIWTSDFVEYTIFLKVLLLQKPHLERGFLRVPRMLKSRSLALVGKTLPSLGNTRYAQVSVHAKKILKIKIPFRCMFKIMKGYKNFDFTPSGKSLKKTLPCIGTNLDWKFGKLTGFQGIHFH